MSENNVVKSLAITLMLFQIIFPIFVFGFTIFNPETWDIGNIDITLDMDSLAKAQVIFSEAKTEELTHGSYVQFDLNESSKKMRIAWDEFTIVNPVTQFRFTKQNIIELNTDTWLWPQKLTVEIDGVTYNPTPPKLDYARNQTIINAFNPDYNWTRAEVWGFGIQVFFTAEKYNNNITQAIDAGKLNCTVGQPMILDIDDYGAFIDWYWSILTSNRDYGLPAFLKWVLQIQTILTIFSAVFLGRELTRL